MPPRLDEGFLRAIRARVAEMPEQRFFVNGDGEPFGEVITNLWQTIEPEPEPELTVNPYENYYNDRAERRYVDSRLWRMWEQQPANIFVDLAAEPVPTEEENKQELDRQWNELMFGKAKA